MTDKVQKIRAEVIRRIEEEQSIRREKEKLTGVGSIIDTKYESLLSFIDSLQEEPTTSVWHDASEKAINNAPILFHSTYDNRWYALSHNRINWNVVDKWAYIDDLMKL